MANASFPVVVTDATRSSLAAFLETLRGCWKASSLLWMQANGFPVLPGVIVNGWTGEAERAVRQFCERGKFNELLVRIEKPGQRWTTRRGGYTIPISEVGCVVSQLAHDSMLALLLEPARPYSDLYSLGAVCGLHTGVADVEIVGPGFDASDILRGDIAPHERLELSLATESDVESSVARNHYIVDPEAYRESVRRRLAKIGASLQGPSLCSDVRKEDTRHLTEEATRYLQQSEQGLLLNHLDRYEPIPEELFGEFVRELGSLFLATRSARTAWKTLSVAGSFLAGSRLVMWDFFVPNDYQTTLLSTILAEGR
ncbi:MAG TPA: hypothetical protein VMF66_04630 [Candidatus Acidoferrum sp.]|nr:hypothetical protein [Candidatus Acidoferrum sp.]